MAPTEKVTGAADSRDAADLDAQLDAAFGPCEPATADLIDASIGAHEALAALERISSGLLIGVADYERRIFALERYAGVAS